MAAVIGSTKNIQARHKRAPSKDVFQPKYFQVGLQFGAPETVNKKHAKFITPNDCNMNIVEYIAIVLSVGINSNA